MLTLTGKKLEKQIYTHIAEKDHTSTQPNRQRAPDG